MNISFKDLFIVFGITLSSFICILNYAYIWPIGGDGNLYLELFYHERVPPPHGYRILLPFILSMMGDDPILMFTLVKYLSLALNSFFIFYIINSFNLSKDLSIYALLIWLFSYPCIYYLTTVIRVDPILFPLISLAYIFTNIKKNYYLGFLLIFLATFIHEMSGIILIYLTAHLISKKYNFIMPFLFILATSVTFFLIRLQIILPASEFLPFYLDDPIGMISSTLDKTSGIIGISLRFYSAYGPLFLYALSFLFINFKKYHQYLILITGLFFISFFAIDTLRVASIIFIFILILGILFLNDLKKTSKLLFYFSISID